MARIYEQQDRTPTGAIPLPSHLRVDPVSRHAIWKYWLSIAALAVAALAFHVYARLAHLSPVAVVVAYALTAAVNSGADPDAGVVCHYSFIPHGDVDVGARGRSPPRIL